MTKSVPDRDEPLVLPNGKINQSWHEYFLELDKRAFREKVSLTAPTNGQVIKYVSATGLWTPSSDLT